MKTLLAQVGRRGAWGGMMALLSGCAVGPNYVRPDAPAADRYTRAPLAAATVAAGGQAQVLVPDARLMADWWRLFQCPALDVVVQTALLNNPSVQGAVAALRQSQDALRAGQGVFFPRVDATAGAARERSEPLQQGQSAAGTVFTLFTVSGAISYPLDLFGGERRAVEALRAETAYQGYLALAARLTLSGNLVQACIARAAYAAEIRATQQLLALEDEQGRLTDAQVRAGTVPYANLLAVRSLIAANQALLAPLAQKVDQTEDLMATLEGVTPAEATLPEIDLDALALPLALPMSLPSDLVRQRPDILAAEAHLQAASAAIGVATAAMFPSVTLSGDAGAASTRFDRLSAASARFWSIGPSATVPVFQGGSLWFGRKAAIEDERQAEALYRQTVLAAFGQVADALHGLVHDAELLQAQTEASQAAAEALHLVQVNYRAGLVDYLDVLSADGQAHEAAIAELQAVAQRQQDTVAIFVAFGGGWWNGASPDGAGGQP